MQILDIETVELIDEISVLRIIDQTLLPGEVKVIDLKEIEDIWQAIYLLQVRGAPAIGVAAGFGIYLAAKKISDDLSYDDFYKEFVKAKDYLNSSRPTAVNLSWALNRMDDLVKKNSDKTVKEIKKMLHDESVLIKEEDTAMCKSIGEYGLSLIKPGDGLLTHCNAGQLATSKYGTATAPMYLGYEKGYNLKIYCDETRPLLQGARLTAYELSSKGLDVTLQCDNMVSALMREGKINAVFVGCDRVAANGDAANKIGTSGVAIIAKHYGVPFYVCAPSSTIDFNIKTGDDIVIEQRKPEEVTEMWYKERMAPNDIKVYNPAFDVTDNELITAIVTEKGIARAPYTESLKELFKK